MSISVPHNIGQSEISEGCFRGTLCRPRHMTGGKPILRELQPNNSNHKRGFDQ